MYLLNMARFLFFLILLLCLYLEPQPPPYIKNRWNQQQEIQSVILGNTSACTQITFLRLQLEIRYTHPKILEYSEIDETSPFSRLNFYNTVRARRDSLFTYINNSSGLISDNSNFNNNSSTTGFEDLSLQTSTANYLVNGGPCNERNTTVRIYSHELTTEEMCLIEILWKQDIDLIVSRRDAYDSCPHVEIEHLKETGLSKDKELYNDLNNGGISDFLKNDFKLLETDLEENKTLCALFWDSYLPFNVNEEFCRLPNVLTNISSDTDYLYESQIHVENELDVLGTLCETNRSNVLTNEIYPNIDNCWSDSYILPLSPHSMEYSSALNNNDNLLNMQQNETSESFIDLLQDIFTEVPFATEDYHSMNISSSVAPSGIGWDLSESIATLTNDTDLLHTSSIFSYDSEFPELLYSNHTQTVPHNHLISDLHFVSSTSNASEEIQIEDFLETSNDSISLTSEPLLSISDYESESSNFSNVPLQPVNVIDSGISENFTNVVIGDILGHSKMADCTIAKNSEMSGSNFVHHNHSYHLPFHSDVPLYKPVTKDKLKCTSEEDAFNKDKKKAKELKLPIDTSDIINLSIEEYNERLSNYELTNEQLALIRDIRRRGKNKVAAQNCRKRKMNQISGLQQELGYLQRERLKVESARNSFLQMKLMLKKKYEQLYNVVLQNSNTVPPNSIPVISNRIPTNSTLLTNYPNKKVRTRRTFKM